MRVEQQPAYLLHRRRYQENGFLLELLTPEFGRVGAIGRGASKRASLLQPFQRLLVSWRQRAGELVSIGAVERDRLPPLGLHPKALTCGLYVNELSLALLARNDPSAAVFDQYQKCLGGLAQGSELDWVLREYEIQLLADLGYGVDLEFEAESQTPVEAEKVYRYEPDYGLVKTRQPERPWCVSGATLLALAGLEKPSALVRREARALMKAVITHRLEGRVLRTRELFNHGRYSE